MRLSLLWLAVSSIFGLLVQGLPTPSAGRADRSMDVSARPNSSEFGIPETLPTKCSLAGEPDCHENDQNLSLRKRSTPRNRRSKDDGSSTDDSSPSEKPSSAEGDKDQELAGWIDMSPAERLEERRVQELTKMCVRKKVRETLL